MKLRDTAASVLRIAGEAYTLERHSGGTLDSSDQLTGATVTTYQIYGRSRDANVQDVQLDGANLGDEYVRVPAAILTLVGANDLRVGDFLLRADGRHGRLENVRMAREGAGRVYSYEARMSGAA